MKSPLPLAPFGFVLRSCFVALLVSVGAAFAATAAPLSVTSPDGKITVEVKADGPLTYRVQVDGVAALADSRLGLRLRDGEFGRAVTVVTSAQRESDTTWTNPFGKQREVRDHHRELAVTLREKTGGREFQVIFRVFNDGVGFRYALPAGAGEKNFVVEEELTEFAFTGDNLVYAGDHVAIPPEDYDMRGGFAGSQEWEYRKQRLSDLSPDTVTGLPIVTQAPTAWIALTEADLLDWAALWLSRVPQTNGTTATTLRARLAPRLDGDGLVKSTLPRNSPWRVLIIGREPGRLVESNLLLNLSTPSQIADTSWIKPGLMSWDRWWSGVGQKDTATMKEFIQLSADMGWPYQLVDGGWYVGGRTPNVDITKHNANIDLPELIRFAKERGVRLWLWLYWTDVARSDYEKVFALYEQWGIAGVKIDFMDRDDQEMVKWYEDVARAGAKHHLMVNFHGAYKPTGLLRTLPNQITSEGILGNEYNKWSRRVTAEHRATLPFTRFLAGPGDYTPGGFVNRSAATFQPHVTPTQVQSTRAGELALFVVYDSPVTCVADHPSNLRDQPGLDLLKVVPTVWDETRVLSGSIGEHIVMARRSGAEWYLGALNNAHRRVKTLKLDFLGEGRWQMRLWRDHQKSSEEAEMIEIEERVVTAADTFEVKMQRSGGAVARFVRVP
ncbi:MAG TPA: glycoside hydrolase family 97 protein [Opitutus sp.]|nr:glycoside hydrolase family 97 protein [Opitutus sp.]